MRPRRPAASVAANPVLIGAATILVLIVAVFLAYNANNGLPFVPTYQLNAEVGNAANLVEGNDVRIGGARVGVVDKITPKAHADGKVTAVLRLKLETRVQPLSRKTAVIVRPRSALGLKYVQLTPGDLKREGALADGAAIPLANATPKPVEIDEVFNTFDARTRQASRQNLVNFSGALAGRGDELNTAVRSLSPLLTNLVPVMRNLRNPRTGLSTFVRAAGRIAAIVAPVAETQAALFRNLDTTFAALSDVRTQLQDTIAKGPETLDTSIRSFRVQRPFLVNTRGLFADLRPGVAALGRTAPTLSRALVTGQETLPRTVALNRRLANTLETLADFSGDPLVKLGITRLDQTANTLRPTVEHLAPAQIVCNYPALWFRNVSSLLSDGDRNGTWQRFIIIVTPLGPNNEGSPSSKPANGPTESNHVHVNPYPNTASPGQPHECEGANADYIAGRTVIGNIPGNQGTNPDKTSIQSARR